MIKANAVKRFIIGKIVFFSLMGTVAIERDMTINPVSYNAPPIEKLEPGAKHHLPTQETIIQKIESEQKVEEADIGTYFPIYYYPGDLGYADKEYDISLDKVVSRTIKTEDTLEKYWIMEGGDPAEKRLYQTIFLTLNLPPFYPKGFNRKYNLKEEDIILPEGKKANFLDLNGDGKVLGEAAEPVKVKDALKITGLKNNWGELLYGPNRR
jgi:hypothetical protein